MTGSYPEKDSTGTEGYSNTFSTGSKGDTLFFLIKKDKTKRSLTKQGDYSLNKMIFLQISQYLLALI